MASFSVTPSQWDIALGLYLQQYNLFFLSASWHKNMMWVLQYSTPWTAVRSQTPIHWWYGCRPFMSLLVKVWLYFEWQTGKSHLGETHTPLSITSQSTYVMSVYTLHSITWYSLCLLWDISGPCPTSSHRLMFTTLMTTKGKQMLENIKLKCTTNRKQKFESNRLGAISHILYYQQFTTVMNLFFKHFKHWIGLYSISEQGPFILFAN